MKKFSIILFLVMCSFLMTRPVDEPTVYKPAPRVIMQNETHEFLEDPVTKDIYRRNKVTGEVVDLQKTKQQLMK